MRAVLGYAAPLALVCLADPAFSAPCDDLLPAATTETPLRDIEARDIATLRSLGGTSHFGMPPPFTLSPDRTQMAFEVRRPNPETNTFCVGVVVAPVTPGAERPRLIASQVDGDPSAGGFQTSVRHFVPVGYGLSNIPRWSPDGQWLAYLRRDGATTQVWRARTDGSASEQVSRSAVDVEDFGWSPDGRYLVYSSRPGVRDALAAIEVEGRSGWHYDNRFNPLPPSNGRPEPTGEFPLVQTLVDLRDRHENPAPADASAWLEGAAKQTWAPGTIARATASDGRVAEIVQTHPERPYAPRSVRVRSALGEQTNCLAQPCATAVDVWWLGEHVVFLSREGWGQSQLALYMWQPGKAQPARTLVTDDLIEGCQPHEGRLLCLHEAATSPRRIVSVDVLSGSISAVFDPNPETSQWRFGRTERLRWTSDLGTETFGDLVLPPDHQPGNRHPLVIVSYISRGFLKGGAGDEYPIHAFAARGYAVLSFHRPIDLGRSVDARFGREAGRVNFHGWQDRRNVHSALLNGIELVRSRNLIDMDRVGITGMSEGSEIARWAILNSNIFKAAAMSSCCHAEVATMALQGPAAADIWRNEYGFPRLHDRAQSFWEVASLDENVERLTIPLLLQIPQWEALLTMSAAARAREIGAPIDLFIFPDEPHFKWRPAHKLAIYYRSLDWFDFWLRGIENPSPERAADYARWRTWRDRREARP